MVGVMPAQVNHTSGQIVLTSMSPTFRPHGNPLAGISFDLVDSQNLKNVNVHDDDEREFFLQHAKQAELEALEQDLTRMGGVAIDLMSVASGGRANGSSESTTSGGSSGTPVVMGETISPELALASVELEFHKHEITLDRLAQQEHEKTVDRWENALKQFASKLEPNIRDILSLISTDTISNVAVYDMSQPNANSSAAASGGLEYLIFATVSNEYILNRVVDGVTAHARTTLQRQRLLTMGLDPDVYLAGVQQQQQHVVSSQSPILDGSTLPPVDLSDTTLGIATMYVTGKETDPWVMMDLGRFAIQLTLGSTRQLLGTEAVCAGRRVHRSDWYSVTNLPITQCIVVQRHRSNSDQGSDRNRKTKNRRQISRHLLKSQAISALVNNSTVTSGSSSSPSGSGVSPNLNNSSPGSSVSTSPSPSGATRV